MYEEYFGFSKKPFSIVPDPHYFFLSAGHAEALAHLLYGKGSF
jgi:general secretion pathway protein A